MASQVATVLALSLLILWTSSALSGDNDAEDCCLSVTTRPIPLIIVRSFRYLLREHGCRVPAVVFTTLRGYQLCAPPNQPWVNRIIWRLLKNSAKASPALPPPSKSLCKTPVHNLASPSSPRTSATAVSP
uniref:C-C motif chemokine n=1 Tax=Rhinolophus ferrumequinum TaxID=59479 RepID=A0A671EA75_RHIFE